MKNTLSRQDFYYKSNLLFQSIIAHKSLATQANARILFDNAMFCLKNKYFAFAKAFFLYAALLGDSWGFHYYYSLR